MISAEAGCTAFTHLLMPQLLRAAESEAQSLLSCTSTPNPHFFGGDFCMFRMCTQLYSKPYLENLINIWMH